MHFEPDKVYHIYNRGNEKQKIFFSRDNCLYFLRKVRTEWTPYVNFLSYCLMPNHFHFILVPNETACEPITLSGKETHLQVFSKTIGKTLSAYTLAINKQERRSGNLFQKKTKAKFLCPNHPVSFRDPYLLACVHYVHLNPVRARLTPNETDWEFSSARDYAGIRNGTLCNQDLLFQISGMKPRDFDYANADSDEILERLF